MVIDVTARDLWMSSPLLALAVAGCAILLFDALTAGRSRRGPFLLALAGLAAAAGQMAAVAAGMGTRVSAFGGMLVMDRSAIFIGVVILVAATLGLLLSRRYLQRAPAPAAEYHALVLFAALGMMAMASTHNLLVMFMGLELLSLSLYILAGITRDWLRSLEAAMKYFLLGAFSTGFILYGMAFLYGATGSLDLMVMGHDMGRLVERGEAAVPLAAGLALVLIGLAFKIAAVPFHWWAPDVYEGAPTPVTGFMAVGTKAAAFLALLRVLVVAFGDTLVNRWSTALAGLALLTMVFGNLVALTQNNIKRLLAYSSVAHGGYLLVAVAAGSDLGASAMLFYFASYVVTTLGAFGVAAVVAETGLSGDEGYGMLRYAGLGWRRPWLALAMSIFLLSLTGVPLTSGFVGKYFIFQAAVERGLPGAGGGRPLFLWLAVIGILASVVSAAYYLRVIVAMYMREPESSPAAARADFPAALALAAAALAVVGLGLFPTPIYEATRDVYSHLQALALFLAPR